MIGMMRSVYAVSEQYAYDFGGVGGVIRREFGTILPFSSMKSAPFFMSLISFILFAIDKKKAIKGKERIKEKTLN